jgi:O-antigen/teichoic acid export membrane protein
LNISCSPPSEPPTVAPSRFLKWRAPLISFFIGQPAVQLLNLITGFLLLRWLDIQEYAMLGIALAFQVTVNQLTDVGFSGSIVALAGPRGQDPDILGTYLRSARYWRTRVQTATLLVAAVAFPLMTWNQTWPPATKALLFGSIALGVVFQGWTMYSSPLLVHHSLRQYYTPQIQSALLRLLLCATLHAAGILPAWVATLISALTVGFTGFSYHRSSRAFIHEPTESLPAANTEMLRYLSPLIPGIIFIALQGQILVGLSAVFGSTQNLAEVSALGRIGQLFLILGAFNSVFIEPYIARISAELLPRRYLQILAVTLSICAATTLIGFTFPQPLLWLLGKNYAGLQAEIGWVVLSGCLAYLGGVLWSMHAARRWIFWWGTINYITTMVVVQSICLAFMDLTQTISVIWFGLFSTTAGLLVHTATGVYGFTQTVNSPSHQKLIPPRDSSAKAHQIQNRE